MTGKECPSYFSPPQNSSSPFLTGLGIGFFGGTPADGVCEGPDFSGLLIDDRAMLSSSSSSSAADFLGTVGFTGGASFRGGAGAVGGGDLDAPGLGVTAAGARLTLSAGACGVPGRRAAVADQPHAVHVPLTFNGSPHSLHSGIGWLDSSN